MKKISIIAFFIVLGLAAGYWLGNIFPLQNQNPGQTSQSSNSPIPSGMGRLEVTVTGENNAPMVGIEIDVAHNPGPPENWGVKEADMNGKATYDLAPGTYYVYFNTNRFPVGYVVAHEQQVQVSAGSVTKLAITLKKN